MPHLADEVNRIRCILKTPTDFTHAGIICNRCQADGVMVSVHGEWHHSSRHVYMRTGKYSNVFNILHSTNSSGNSWKSHDPLEEYLPGAVTLIVNSFSTVPGTRVEATPPGENSTSGTDSLSTFWVRMINSVSCSLNREVKPNKHSLLVIILTEDMLVSFLFYSTAVVQCKS